MKKWLFLILLFPLICVAQTYRYLGVEDGLSNRRVYCIQKDKTGYMWFLTHEGIDRYNGKEFKRYKLMDGDAEVNSLLNLNWLYIDQEGVLWEIGKKEKYSGMTRFTTASVLYINYRWKVSANSRTRSLMPGSTRINTSGYAIKILSFSIIRTPNKSPI